MNSARLANEVLEICMDAGRRITGVGNEQYVYDSPGDQDGVRQKTEDYTIDEHLEGLEEELLDTINWAAMTILKIRRQREQANSNT